MCRYFFSAMPEALAILGILVVTIVAWVSAWSHTRNPANFNTRDEVARLQQHAAWLEQRLELAQRENWGADMIDSLTDEMKATSEHLVRLRRT